MATAENKLFSPIKWTVKANATAGTATATKTAPGAGLRHYITGFIVSSAPVSTVASAVDMTDGGTSVLTQDLAIGFGVNPLVVQFSRPYECAENAAAAVSAGSFGAAVVGRVTLMGFTA